MPQWSDVEPILRDRAYSTIDNDPQVLLEQDGGPSGMTADVVCARFLGFDDQIEEEWRISRAEPVLLRVLPTPISVTLTEPELARLSELRTARYELQSGYVLMTLDPGYALPPPDVKVGPPDFTYTVLFVRYRRRT